MFEFMDSISWCALHFWYFVKLYIYIDLMLGDLLLPAPIIVLSIKHCKLSGVTNLENLYTGPQPLTF